MKKVYLNVFSTFLVFMLLVCFSCKKSAPEVVEETPTESVQQEAEPEITTEEEPVKEEPVIEQKKEKISETQFKEIEDLIANDIDGIHIYTMNKAATACEIMNQLSV